MQINPSLIAPDFAAAETNGPTILRMRRERHTIPLHPRTVQPLRHHWYMQIKGVIDWVLAALLILPALPLVLLSALLVRLTSRGPVFYTQTRVGKNGKPFTIIKIRTMYHNCEAISGARWCVPGDPRITPVGYVLRKTHLDELPQLLNVLRGEMSLIGPRPERPEFVPELERALPGYRQRLNVRPGVTGLAQVQLPPDTDLESVRRKLAHDLYYVRHLSPWLDLKLFICTAFYALGVPFRLLSRLFGVPASHEIERAVVDVVPDTPIRSRMAA